MPGFGKDDLKNFDLDRAYVTHSCVVESGFFFCICKTKCGKCWYSSTRVYGVDCMKCWRRTRKDDIREHEWLDGISVYANALTYDLPTHLALVVSPINELDPVNVNNELE